ncbi:MAG: PRC-barrel domain-containing protein [Microvirga sp.]
MAAPQPGTFATSDLIGQNVHGADHEEIGTVTEVLVDPEGHVAGGIIAVGEYLGAADTKFAAPMPSLDFGRQNDDQPATTGAVGDLSSSPAPSATAAGDGAPSHIVLIITKGQLQYAPKFQEAPKLLDPRIQTSRSHKIDRGSSGCPLRWQQRWCPQEYLRMCGKTTTALFKAPESAAAAIQRIEAAGPTTLESALSQIGSVKRRWRRGIGFG